MWYHLTSALQKLILLYFMVTYLLLFLCVLYHLQYNVLYIVTVMLINNLRVCWITFQKKKRTNTFFSISKIVYNLLCLNKVLKYIYIEFYSGISNALIVPISPVLAALSLTAAILFGVVCVVSTTFYRKHTR